MRGILYIAAAVVTVLIPTIASAQASTLADLGGDTRTILELASVVISAVLGFFGGSKNEQRKQRERDSRK